MTFTNRIEDEMTAYPVIANPRMSVNEAADIMEREKIRHIPVVQNGKVIGILSDRDLKQPTLLSDSMQLLVSDVMTPNPYCAKVGTALWEVVREMAQKKFGSAVVLDLRGRVIGIFTTTDGMRVLAEMLEDGAGQSSKMLGIERFLSGNTLT